MKWLALAAAAVVSAWALNASAATIIENVTFNDDNVTYDFVSQNGVPSHTYYTFFTSDNLTVPTFTYNLGDTIQLNVTLSTPINVTQSPSFQYGMATVSTIDAFGFTDSGKMYGVGGNLSFDDDFTEANGKTYVTGYTSHSYPYQSLPNGKTSLELTHLYLQVGAVPEPSLWLLLLIGVGFMGGAIRRLKDDALRTTRQHRNAAPN